jgi:hypothetical protein
VSVQQQILISAPASRRCNDNLSPSKENEIKSPDYVRFEKSKRKSISDDQNPLRSQEKEKQEKARATVNELTYGTPSPLKSKKPEARKTGQTPLQVCAPPLSSQLQVALLI